MKIREAKKPEAERITRKLWLPLAREMEKVSDYNELKDDLDIESCVERKREGIREEGEYMFIAEERELLGFISATVKETPPVFTRGDKMKINELYVKKEVRRKGVASKLMEKVEETADKENCSTIELEFDVGNQEAQKFYQKEGFEKVRERMVKSP